MKESIIMNRFPERRVKACLEARPDRPFIGEIGFGNGEFLIHLARTDPDALFWGFEVSRTCLLKCLSKAKSEGLDNIRLLFGDARFLLRECFPDSAFDGLYMNFPCPWPKTKHAKRRITAGAFPDVLAAVLKTGGFYELATDDDVYASAVKKTLDAHPAISCDFHRINAKRPLTTKYERKWIAADKTIHVVRFRKTKHWTVERISEGSAPMHLEYNGPAPDMRSLSKLRDRQGGSKNSRWIYKTSYQGSDGTFLLETMTADGQFRQHFFLKIVPRGKDVLVKTDPSTRPFATPSVKAAMHELVCMLEKGVQE